jgi:outer membrane receptor for ferrienterochelin and colicins
VLRGALGLLLLACAAEAARAEDAPVHEAEPIVVEGEREPLPIEVYRDAPIETQVVGEEEIESVPAQDAAEVVRMLPGVRTQQRVQGEEAAVSIEGMPPEYTKVLVNGQRYTGQLGAVADLADVPLTNVKQIEVLRGSQALRYGTDAAGGVINVVTKPPPESGTTLEIETGAGDQHQVTHSGTLGVRSGALGLALSGTYDQIGGYAPIDDADAVFVPAGGPHSRNKVEDGYGLATYDLGESLRWRSNLGWRRERERFVPEEEEAGVASEVQGVSHRRFERWLGGSGLEWRPAESLRLEGGLHYYRGITNSEVGREFELDEDEWKLDLYGEHLAEWGPLQHVLAGGVDLRRPRLRLDEGELPAGVEIPGLSLSGIDEEFRSTGLFLSSESIWWDRLSLLLGARIEAHSEFDSEVLPQIALRFQPWRPLALRASWGRNARTPSLRDLYQPPVPQVGGAYFLAGSPDLQPESSESWRAGIELTPHPKVYLAATGFWNEIDDMIRNVPAAPIAIGSFVLEERTTGTLPPTSLTCQLNPSDVRCAGSLRQTVVTIERPLFRKANLDHVRTRGVEAVLHVQPHAWVDLLFAYTYLDTDVDSERFPDLEELPNEPHHAVEARALFTLPKLRTRLGATAHWRGRSLRETSGTGLATFVDADEKTDHEWTLDLRLSQPIGDRFEAFVDVRNVTDRRVVDSYQIRGRSFFVGLRANFDFAGGKGTP